MTRKWFTLVDTDGKTLRAVTGVRVQVNDVDGLRKAVIEKARATLRDVNADELKVFANGKSFQESLKFGRKLELKRHERIHSFGTKEDALFVVAPRRLSPQDLQPEQWVSESMLTAPSTSTSEPLCSVDPSDMKTLRRSALTRKVIDRLEIGGVLLIQSPPTTGKSSLAALMKQKLSAQRAVHIASLSMFGAGRNETFNDVLDQQCGMDFDGVKGKSREGYTVYLIVDEAQKLFMLDPTEPHRRESFQFWELVRFVLSNPTCGIRVLMIAAYGSNLDYHQLSIPVTLPVNLVLDAKFLILSQAETNEYVSKWFAGWWCLRDYTNRFCLLLRKLCDGHIGLCATAVHVLNEEYQSFERTEKLDRCYGEWWTRMLTRGPLKTRLFHAFESTRAVKVFKALGDERMRCLERLQVKSTANEDGDVLDLCAHLGILTSSDTRFEFASSTMRDSFQLQRLGGTQRATFRPTTLQELVLRCLDAIEYESVVFKTLGRSRDSLVALEVAWQHEFHTALSTSSTFTVSADVGALFESPGRIDFTVHDPTAESKPLWGIELLREGDKLDDHIARFLSNGRYARLNLSDYCLIDFRRFKTVASMMRSEKLKKHLRHARLYIVCYTEADKNVHVFLGQATWIFENKLRRRNNSVG